MRKVPNVNTHIFKQPGLPWQTASFSDAALSVFDRMSSLTDLEKQAIATFVDAEVSAGNWDKIDEFYCFCLNSTDWLTGFKSKMATNAGATKVVGGASFDGSGTDRISTVFNPTSDNGLQTQNDAGFSAFFKEITTAANNTRPVWASTFFDQIRYQPGTTIIGYSISNNTLRFTEGTDWPFGDEINVYVERTGATDTAIYIDGVNSGGNGGTSSSVRLNGDYKLGYNSDCIISAFYQGAALADPAAYNTNVRALLTTLGAI